MKKVDLITWIFLFSLLPHALLYADENSEGEKLINELLQQLTPQLNKGWPSIAVQSGLDPYENVYDGKISLKCKYGGDEVCGAQASSCKDMWAEIKVRSIGGLASLQFKDLGMTSIDGTSDMKSTTCKYENSANGGNYSYAYWGEGSGKAYLLSGTKLTADISTIKVKVKCNLGGFMGTFKETLYSGSAKCEASQPTGSSNFELCGGSCQSKSPVTVISYMGMESLSLHVKDLSCKVNPNYNPVSWISEMLVPFLKDEITKALTPPIERALNDLFASVNPYPSVCK